MANYDVEKLTKLGALKALAERVKGECASKTEFDELSDDVAQLETNVGTLQEDIEALKSSEGEQNIIESIKVNDEVQAISEKSVNIVVPKKTSELDNDAGYINEDGVQNLVNAGINKFATDISDDNVVNTFKEMVDYVSEHGEEAVDMATNIQKNAGDIEDLKTLVGSTNVSDQIDAALDGYVQKDGDKVLSTNDYTTADKEKLDGIEYASEQEVSDMLNEVFVAI